MSSLIQFRRGTAAEWSSANPTLASGEVGFAYDTGVWKIGNGSTAWNSLSAAATSNAFTSLDLTGTSDPGVSASGHATVYAKTVANRMILKIVGPSGLDTGLQPFLARNKIGAFTPPGNATTATVLGAYTAPTASGTATARNVATTNMFTRMRRLGYVSSATAGNLAGPRVAAAQVTVGGVTAGGFFKVIRFGISDAATVSGARMFVGMSSSTSAPTNVEPSTLTNAIGVGHGAADTNLKIFRGGSSAQTPIDLGANFPTNTLNTDVYELALFAPSDSSDVYYEVTRLNTGHVATGLLSNSGGVALPANTTLLTYCQAWRSNNATALAVGLDIMSDYIETDY